jgi:hypothetical protein
MIDNLAGTLDTIDTDLERLSGLGLFQSRSCGFEFFRSTIPTTLKGRDLRRHHGSVTFIEVAPFLIG